MSTSFSILCGLSLIVYIILAIVKAVRDKRENKAMKLLIEAHKQKINGLSITYKRKIG